ncbi:MAG TPA: protein kinase [Kofleriaceae bacterium]|nr:protein kinase [Kofleriaceae bacterium]
MEDRRRWLRQNPPARDRGLAAPDPRIGKVLDERYRLEERLAAGGMGVVYRAERLGLARQVAVKFLHRSAASVPGHRARFEREAAAMSRVTHPNLVSIIDFGSADGVPYLVMDFYPGITLRRALKAGAMEPRRAVFVARQILAGVGSAHASGVVHRDLKPGNVLLVGSPGEDLIKILDFGVAKLLEGGGGPSDLSTVAGYVLGTPEYMAPEQARSERIDHRVDLYAVGVLLYEMLAGRLPFQAEGDLAILHKHIEETPRRLRALVPEVSDELEEVASRALEKDRAHRWQTAAEFSRALSAVPEGGTAPLDTEAAPSPPRLTDDLGAPPPPRRGRARAGDEPATVARRAPARSANEAGPAAREANDEPRRGRAAKGATKAAAKGSTRGAAKEAVPPPTPAGAARSSRAANEAAPSARGAVEAGPAGREASDEPRRGRAADEEVSPAPAAGAPRRRGAQPPPPPPPGRKAGGRSAGRGARAASEAPTTRMEALVRPETSAAATRLAPLGGPEASAAPTRLAATVHPDASASPTRLAPVVMPDASGAATRLFPAPGPDASAAPTRVAPLAEPDASAAPTRLTARARGDGTGATATAKSDAAGSTSRTARAGARRRRRARGSSHRMMRPRAIVTGVVALAAVAAGVWYAATHGAIDWPSWIPWS